MKEEPDPTSSERFRRQKERLGKNKKVRRKKKKSVVTKTGRKSVLYILCVEHVQVSVPSLSFPFMF
jgi:hypothetical protein